MIGEMFIIAILVILINIILIFKKVPLFAVPMSIFTIYISATQFLQLPSATLPMNPIFTLFILLVAICNLLVNGAEMKQ